MTERRYIWAALLMTGVSILGFGIWIHHQTPVDPQVGNVQVEVAQGQASPVSNTTGISTSANRANPSPSAQSAAYRGIAPPPAGSVVPETRGLVNALVELDLVSGFITPTQAAEWHNRLQELTAWGSSAVPAIREFLAKNQDYDFTQIPGGKQLEYSSARSAMIAALQQIGGAEAVQLSVETLANTAVPSEVLQLARGIEQQYPGLYRQEIQSSANELFHLAKEGYIDDMDVGPIFQALREYGDASSLTQFEQGLEKWPFYASLGLAGLQDGEGIPTLLREGTDTKQNPVKADFALKTLGQSAATHPNVANALLEHARSGAIPERAWRQIIAGVVGNQFDFGAANPGQSSPGATSYLLPTGNQAYHTVPFRAVVTPEMALQRQEFLDQLSKAKLPESALTLIDQARQRLLAYTKPLPKN